MKFPSQVKTRNAVGIVLAAVLLTSLLCYLSFAQSPSNTFTISSGIYPTTATYTIYKEGSTYYAKNAYGAIEYSGTNSSKVVQDALDSIASFGGGSLYFSPHCGTYVFKYSMAVPDNCLIDFGWSRIEMDNYFVPAVTGTSQWGMFYNKGAGITKNVNSTIRNGIIYGNNQHQNGASSIFTFKNVTKFNLENLMMEYCAYDARDAIIYSLASACYIDHVYGFEAGVVDGAWVGLRGCHYMKIRNCHFENAMADLIVVYNEDVDTGGVNYVSWDIDISHCTLIGAGRNAVRVETGCYDVTVEDCDILATGSNTALPSYCDHSAIFIYGLKNFQIVNNRIIRYAHNQTYAIYIYGYTVQLSNVKIEGNLIRDSTVGHIYLENCTNIDILDNTFSDTATVLTKASGVSNLIVKNNIGFVTQNSGTAIISSSTYVNVAHGLSGTPTAVIVTPTQTSTSFYVSNVGSTTFRINVGTSGTYTFYWYAEYNP